MNSWTVVVPVKGTRSQDSRPPGTTPAKSRLGASPELALAIALDSVAAVLAPHQVAEPREVPRVIVVAAARAGIAAAGAGPVAVLLGDVPALLPSELAAALESAESHPLAFVPDADDTGTVLITALTARDHAPAFGVDSRAAHLVAGYIELAIPVDSGLRRDVDTAAQLSAILARVGPRTRAAAGL